MTAAVVQASTSPCRYGNWCSHSPALWLQLLPASPTLKDGKAIFKNFSLKGCLWNLRFCILKVSTRG